MSNLNPLFENAVTIRKTFTTVPNLSGAQGTALTTVADHFASIASIVSEAKLPPAYAEMVYEQLLAVEGFVISGISTQWNGGKSNY